ncbi:hypothetical protein V5799_033561 [Amblyomma americanum]|uniref:Uncharacterized protein n=1 Tax=Amblyomma americanum TaxID=6943 RepID=A0AAQ4DMY9_AMBAM
MASIPTTSFYSMRPRLNLSRAEAILEAIASQDGSDLDLSDDELNEKSTQAPQPDVSCSDDSDEEDSGSGPLTSVGKFPPWRHAPFVSSLPDVPDTPDTETDSRTNWTALDYFKQYFSEEFYRNMHEKSEG